MKHWMKAKVGATLVLMAAIAPHARAEQPAAAQLAARRLPGVQAQGETLLPSAWSLRPAGTQLQLGDFPVNIALHPTKPLAAVLHAGYGPHGVWLIDLRDSSVAAKAELSEAFYGLAFDPEGKRLYASGAQHRVVHEFEVGDKTLKHTRQISLVEGAADDEAAAKKPDPKNDVVAAGVVVSRDGKTLYAACTFGDRVTAVSLDGAAARRELQLPAGSYPYAVHEAPDGKLYVSLWGASAVAVIDEPRKERPTARVIETDPHPTEMAMSPDGARLFVACANACTVSVIDVAAGRRTETLTASLFPAAPAGSTPNSLSLTPDGKVLFVANADNNNLAVLDVSKPGAGRSLGFIPVGWYPTSVRYRAADQTLYVANGKGLTSKSNVRFDVSGSNAGAATKPVREFIGGLFKGTLSAIPSPGPKEMVQYTRQAYECSPLRQNNTVATTPRDADNPIPAKVGDPSPIKHCIYIIKENRTYDQVLGDMPEGNGDPRLCLFGEETTPNHHALARKFVLLDNFYVDGEVSADGHEWTMAAYATDYVEKTWPLVYRKGSRGVFRYPAEGSISIAAPTAGYLWDRCAKAGVSYRSYGEFIGNGEKPDDPGTAKVKALEGHFDPQFRSFDVDYPDQKRADRFIEELKRFEREGDLPRFIVMRLPNDHTAGTSVGKWTPRAMVADNDLALGRVVEAVSRSRFWKETAIFVVEDDAQNGPDHVDAHRTVAFVVSPYAKRKAVDSTMYSTSAMLRTMELILGLEPMSQFDAAATPMYASFQSTPDLTPYDLVPAKLDLNERNEPTAWGSHKSAELDFTKEDAADDLVLNDIVWRSIRGGEHPVPPPVRAAFFFPKVSVSAKDKDDDD